jgi:cell division protease FtsH
MAGAGLPYYARSVRQPDEEAGTTCRRTPIHGLLGKLLPQATPPHKVTILPRGVEIGYVIPLPREERYAVTRSEILANITPTRGGAGPGPEYTCEAV